MESSVLTLEAAKALNISVIENGRGTQAVHDAVVAMRANRRAGTACTKTRGEVAGSNKKLYRQKGTGNARAGERRSPTRSGGGVAHGPKPRDYSKKVSKKTRRLAFRKAFSERIKAGDVFNVSDFNVADGKTKSFISLLSGITDSNKVLVVASAFAAATFLAGRNYGGALLMSASEVNTEHLLNYKKIIITADAFETLSRRTA
ncbi:MAG: 50S ribosomal protein L4 [Verrucomicrobiaceae bacterium]|nr:MAG: 50S ribosomal protein L4 [Verrucomicrobiaceae bacterium]